MEFPIYAVVVSIPFFVIAFVLARAWSIGIPAIFWLVEYAGRRQGWWGEEPGEFTELLTVMLLLFGAAAALLGWATRWFVTQLFLRARINRSST